MSPRQTAWPVLAVAALALASGCAAPDPSPAAYPGTQGKDCVAVDDREIPSSRGTEEARPPRTGGYQLTVILLEDGTCHPVVGAQVEAWAAGQDGTYETGGHATFPGGAAGVARMDVDPPGTEGDDAAVHMHLLVTAPGYCTQVGEHFPRPGEQSAFEVVVLREDDGTCPTFGSVDPQPSASNTPSSTPSVAATAGPDL